MQKTLFHSRHPDGGSQPSITPVPGHPASSGIQSTACVRCTAIRAHKTPTRME